MRRTLPLTGLLRAEGLLHVTPTPWWGHPTADRRRHRRDGTV